MSQAPGSPGSEFLTERGYNVPRCTQFSVFLDNRVGKLHELVEVFSGRPIRIAALSVNEASDHAVVRLVTSSTDKTRALLEEHGLPFTESEILVVELGNQRLAHLCLSLLGAELSVYYAYPLMVTPHGSPTIALHTDDQTLAGQIMQRKGFNLIGEEELRRAIEGG